jgi:hypothetical protein
MTSLSKPVAKKRGRPVGSKNKPKKIILSRTQVELARKLGVTPVQLAKEKLKLTKKRKPAAASKSFKQAELQRLRKVGEIVGKNIELMKDNTELVSHINNLEHQIIGFRAVISYLEKQAGLRNTQ